MPSHSRRSSIAATAGRPTLLLVGLLVVAGCSSSNSSPGAAAPSSSPSSATSPGSPSATPSKHPRSSPTSEPSSAAPTEFNPPGDIPDNAVFVDHAAPGSRVHFTVPEGWARSRSGRVTTYTDKYNSISIEVSPTAKAPTTTSARRVEVPLLQKSVSHFQLQDVTTASREHGTAVLVTYLMDSAANPVTGKVVRDAVERFEFWHRGELAALSLAGPQNADNVDPWQIVSDSLHWQ